MAECPLLCCSYLYTFMTNHFSSRACHPGQPVPCSWATDTRMWLLFPLFWGLYTNNIICESYGDTEDALPPPPPVSCQFTSANLHVTLLWLPEMSEEILSYNLLLSEIGDLLEFAYILERGTGEGEKELSTHPTKKTGAYLPNTISMQVMAQYNACAHCPTSVHTVPHLFPLSHFSYLS